MRKVFQNMKIHLKCQRKKHEKMFKIDKKMEKTDLNQKKCASNYEENFVEYKNLREM